MYSIRAGSQGTLVEPDSLRLTNFDRSSSLKRSTSSEQGRDRSRDSIRSEFSTGDGLTSTQTKKPKSLRSAVLVPLAKLFSRKHWAPEILALFLAAIDIAVMAIILKRYDRRLFSSWTLPITLNALISLLVTLLYMLLMSPISSCLGQLKWTHFSADQKLFDFHVYDHASKGVTGSLLLVFRKPLDALAVTGALLTIALTAVGPFVQQIISVDYADHALQDVVFPNGSQPIPSLPVASKWDPKGLGLSDARIDPGLEYAVYNGLMSNRKESYGIQSNCGQTNCTWANYSTLAVKSSCLDVSQLLKNTTTWTNQGNGGGFQTLNLSMPNGHSFQITNLNSESNSGAGMNVSSTVPTINFNGTGNMLVDFSVIYTKYGQNPEAQDPQNKWYTFQQFSWECMLHIVQQPLQANFTDSILNEVNNGSAIANNSDYAVANSPWTLAKALIAGDKSQSDCPSGPPCMLNGTDLQSAYINYPGDGSNSPFYTQLGASVYLAEFLMGRVFNGTVQYLSSSSPDSNGSRLNYHSQAASLQSPQLSALFYPFATNAKSQQYGNLSLADLMNNVAASMTRYLRAQQPFPQGDAGASYAHGTRHAQLLVYSIDWPWIALPAALLVATAALLVFTAWDSRRKNVPVWTTNSLAALAHGPDEDDVRDTLKNTTELRELEKISKTMKLRFDPASRALLRAKTVGV